MEMETLTSGVHIEFVLNIGKPNPWCTAIGLGASRPLSFSLSPRSLSPKTPALKRSEASISPRLRIADLLPGGSLSAARSIASRSLSRQATDTKLFFNRM